MLHDAAQTLKQAKEKKKVKLGDQPVDPGKSVSLACCVKSLLFSSFKTFFRCKSSAILSTLVQTTVYLNVSAYKLNFES